MALRVSRLTFLALFMAATSLAAEPKAEKKSLSDFQARAARFKSVIMLPTFELTTNEVAATVKKTIATGNAALDTIAQLPTGKTTFKDAVAALDDLGYQIGLGANRLALIKETSTDAAIRDAA